VIPARPLEALEDLLHSPPVERAASTEEQRLVGRAGTALAHAADDRRPGGAADRHDPFLGALAHDLEGAVGPQIAQAQAGRLRDPKAAIEEEQEDRPVADVSDREEPPHCIVADRLDELVGIRTFDLLIQGAPDVRANRRFHLSVARIRLCWFWRAVRLNMPDGVR